LIYFSHWRANQVTTATNKSGAGRFILRALLILIGLGVAFFLLLQLVPVNRTNPPLVSEPNWDSPATRDLAKRACFDCHSNETTWPWYSNIAPISWQVQRDVLEGRQKLNFSEWGQGEQEMDEIEKVILQGEMPPRNYLTLHPSAKLSAGEKQVLVQGLPGGMAEGVRSGEGDSD
jgi:hypothetical protein